MLKITISGYYVSNSKRVDYEGVEVSIPECDENRVLAEVVNRAVPKKFSTAKDPYTFRGKCYIDKIKKDKTKPRFIGKSIKEFDWDAIQDLAIAYNLNAVPLFRSTSLMEARIKTYQEYCNVVKGMGLKNGFDYANAEDISFVDDTADEQTAKGDLPLE